MSLQRLLLHAPGIPFRFQCLDFRDPRHAFSRCQGLQLPGMAWSRRSWWWLSDLCPAELHALQQQAMEEQQALEDHKQLQQKLTKWIASAEVRLARARQMPVLQKLSR